MSTQYQIHLQYLNSKAPIIAGTYVSQSRANAMLTLIRALAKTEILDARVIPINYRNKKEKRKWFLSMLKKREAERSERYDGSLDMGEFYADDRE